MIIRRKTIFLDLQTAIIWTRPTFLKIQSFENFYQNSPIQYRVPISKIDFSNILIPTDRNEIHPLKSMRNIALVFSNGKSFKIFIQENWYRTTNFQFLLSSNNKIFFSSLHAESTSIEWSVLIAVHVRPGKRVGKPWTANKFHGTFVPRSHFHYSFPLRKMMKLKWKLFLSFQTFAQKCEKEGNMFFVIVRGTFRSMLKVNTIFADFLVLFECAICTCMREAE